MSYKEYTLRIYDNGAREYFNKAGQYHREDGPAIEWANGTKEWWVNGEPHRTDGPAIELTNGTKEWWVNGQRVSKSEI